VGGIGKIASFKMHHHDFHINIRCPLSGKEKEVHYAIHNIAI
jgi:hypothetical protein